MRKKWGSHGQRRLGGTEGGPGSSADNQQYVKLPEVGGGLRPQMSG